MVSFGGKLRTSTYLRVVPRQFDYAVYHGLLGRLCLVDRATLKLLKRFKVPKTKREVFRGNGEQADSFIRFFYSRGLLIESDFDEDGILDERRRQREHDLTSGRQIRIIQLILSNRCNFRCTYCFEGLGGTPLSETIYAYSSPERLQTQVSPGNSTMKKELAEAYLEAVIGLAKNAGNKTLTVQFFGGEPMTNWQTIRHILDNFGSGKRYGIELSYSLVTNGSIITKETAETLKEFDVPVVVSYDSPKSDARPLPSGKGSHEVVQLGLEMLRAHGNRIVLNSVLGEATFDEFDRGLIDFAFCHGVYEIGVLLDLDPSFYKRRRAGEIVNKLWDVCVYGASKGVLVTGYWRQIFEGIAANDRYSQIGFQNCSAMGVQLSIEPSGEVFSCKASGGYFGNILALGTLLRSETYKRYAMRACISPLTCRGCPIEHFCGGLCLGSVESKHKHDIYAVEDSTCEVYREVTQRLILSAGEDNVPALYLGPSASGRQETRLGARGAQWAGARQDSLA